MSDEKQYNPFYESPVCRASEVVTLHELRGMYVNAHKGYEETSWFRPGLKFQYLHACQLLAGLLMWIEDGKPQ